MSRYTHSNRGPITKEDNRVHGSGQVHNWKIRTKPMGAVAKKFEYEQKRDNTRSTVAGVYELGWVGIHTAAENFTQCKTKSLQICLYSTGSE